jgi:hypothetical protein
LAIAVVLLYLRLSSFGIRHQFDAILSLEFLDSVEGARIQLQDLLRRHALRMRLTSERSVDAATVAMSYHLQLRDPSRSRELEQELSHLAHVKHVSMYMHEDESEV